MISYNHTDQELIKLSLIPYADNTQNINIIKENIQRINNKITKKKYFEQFNIIEKNKLRNCPICNKNYETKTELKNHLILECVNIDFCDDNENKINLNNDIKSM